LLTAVPLASGTPVEVGAGPNIFMFQGGPTNLISYTNYVEIGAPAPVSLTQSQFNANPPGSMYVPPQGPGGTLPNGAPVEVGNGPGIFMVQNGQTRLFSYANYVEIGAPAPIRLTRAQLNAIPSGAMYVPPPIVATTRTNWSGYVAETSFAQPQANSVTAVDGSWIVPKVTGAATGQAESSVWVGIDGFGGSTLEQIGTAQDVVNGTSAGPLPSRSCARWRGS
jgi:hypothetical protein